VFRWQELRDSWLDTLPPTLSDQKVKTQLNSLLDYFLPPILRLVRRECHEPVVTKDTELVTSLFKLLNCLLAEFSDEDTASSIPLGDISRKVDGALIFSLIWSTGASTDTKGRTLYNDKLRELLEGSPWKFPPKGSVYDWRWDPLASKWLGWLDTVPAYSIPNGALFGEILVPTVDTVRYMHLMTTLLTCSYHSLFVGDTGTGKSVMIKDRILKGLPEKYVPQFMNFSAQTRANQTQDIIDGKVDKRRKGVFGPPLGKKMIVFVDDLNMPAKEKYGAQPPIEILRQLIHWGGWWDRKEIEWRSLIDLIFIAGMGLPGGGRTHLTCRYTRWFNIISVTPIDPDGMTRIFATILGWFMGQFTSISAAAVVQPVVQATLEVFQTVSVELLPTPSKSHYTFNLRDIAKVVQGVLNTSPSECASETDIFRLWTHEVRRVFQDRLTDEIDRAWFEKMHGEVVQKHFKKSMSSIIGNGADGKGMLLYCDFLDKNCEYEQRKYGQVKEVPRTLAIIEEYLQEYNAVSKSQMNLVLFNYVLEHCCRMTRVLRQPAGHALLVGVGGSGRQSVARLAAAMGEFELFQIEISKNYNRDSWFEDLRALFRKAGEKNERVAFLFTDTQVKMETMLEDINCILNTGTVPNLFPPEEVRGGGGG
jgi:dynein heavy chain